MSAQEYKRRLFEAVQNLLWKQWTALGIPGQIAVADSETILDPEALIVFSAGFARYDQRLYDLILDWLLCHSSQINIQRLKAIQIKSEWQDSASLGYIASVMAESDAARWKKLADCFAAEASEPTALFRDMDDRPESFIPICDPPALRCGFRRNLRQKSGKIPTRLPQTPASLLLRIRGLLGISARAETILILLASKHCKVQQIVNRSGFTWKSIQDVLEEMVAGNWVGAVNGSNRGKVYFLNDPEKIRMLFGIHSFSFPAWTTIYDSIGLLWRFHSNPALAKVSEETFQNELKNLYRGKIQPKQLDSDFSLPPDLDRDIAEFLKIISLT